MRTFPKTLIFFELTKKLLVEAFQRPSANGYIIHVPIFVPFSKLKRFFDLMLTFVIALRFIRKKTNTQFAQNCFQQLIKPCFC